MNAHHLKRQNLYCEMAPLVKGFAAKTHGWNLILRVHMVERKNQHL